jgi:hypothetical protein
MVEKNSRASKFLGSLVAVSKHPVGAGLRNVFSIAVLAVGCTTGILIWHYDEKVDEISASLWEAKENLTEARIALAGAQAQAKAKESIFADQQEKIRALESKARELEGLRVTIEGLNARLGIESATRNKVEEDRNQLNRLAAQAVARLAVQEEQLASTKLRADSLQTELRNERREAARRSVSSPTLEAQGLWENGGPSPKAIDNALRVDEVLSTYLLRQMNDRGYSIDQIRATTALAASASAEIRDCDALIERKLMDQIPLLISVFLPSPMYNSCLKSNLDLRWSIVTRSSVIATEMRSLDSKQQVTGFQEQNNLANHTIPADY